MNTLSDQGIKELAEVLEARLKQTIAGFISNYPQTTTEVVLLAMSNMTSSLFALAPSKKESLKAFRLYFRAIRDTLTNNPTEQ